MKIIGISGQSGAGKSALAEMLSSFGLGRNIEVDSVGHDLLDEPEISEKLCGYFGEDIKSEKGFIDRKKLGAKAFATNKSLEFLNSVMHPAMRELVRKEISIDKAKGEKFAIINAALLYKMRLDEMCDLVVYVRSKPEERLERLVNYRNWTRESAKERLFSQDPEPVSGSGIVFIDNNGTLSDLRNKAKAFAEKLLNSC
ncbi:MAG: dephospho-CoA kinase [Candidatus Riflebacteria bacterium]|nr:dephospho-CoA kinase [Candidatus Riflebacteria bacterium]